MVHPVPSWLITSLITTFCAEAVGHAAATELKLTLVIYDRAHLPGSALADAEGTVSEIFVRARVQLIWRDGFAFSAERQRAEIPIPDDPATLVIKLQPASDARHYGVRPECGGIGLPSGAIVFVGAFDRTNKASATRLGYIIAHELGHVLLGPDAHSIVGIMRGTFLREDWQKAEQGTLGFTRSQNQQIRDWIVARSMGRRSSV
jgi:hypothetical protein